MAKTPEGKVKDKVVAILKARNAYYFFPATGGYGRSGVPDIIACIKGVFIAIECKADLNKKGPTELQKRELTLIDNAGGVATVVDANNIEHLEETLRVIFDLTDEERETLDYVHEEDDGTVH